MPTVLRKRKSRTKRKDPFPSRSRVGDSASAEGTAPSSVRSLQQRLRLTTFPKKIGAAVLGAVVASAVSYFIGADFWKGVEKKAGFAGAPVQVTTLTDVDSFKSDVVHVPEFVVQRPVNEIPPPPNGDLPDGRYAWAHKLGGVDATATLFRFSVVGKESNPVLLQGLRVKLVSRRPAMKGSLITYSGLGAPQSVRYIAVDLSKDPPSWDYIGPKGKPEEHFPLRVSASEPEVFDVQAFSGRGDVSWYLQLDYTADGEQKTIEVKDHGKPFRTTESRTTGQTAYAWTNGRWEPLPTP